MEKNDIDATSSDLQVTTRYFLQTNPLSLYKIISERTAYKCNVSVADYKMEMHKVCIAILKAANLVAISAEITCQHEQNIRGNWDMIIYNVRLTCKSTKALSKFIMHVSNLTIDNQDSTLLNYYIAKIPLKISNNAQSIPEFQDSKQPIQIDHH